MTGSKFSFYTPSFSVGTGDEAVDISAPTPTHSNTDVTKAAVILADGAAHRTHALLRSLRATMPQYATK